MLGMRNYTCPILILYNTIILKIVVNTYRLIKLILKNTK